MLLKQPALVDSRRPPAVSRAWDPDNQRESVMDGTREKIQKEDTHDREREEEELAHNRRLSAGLVDAAAPLLLWALKLPSRPGMDQQKDPLLILPGWSEGLLQFRLLPCSHMNLEWPHVIGSHLHTPYTNKHNCKYFVLLFLACPTMTDRSVGNVCHTSLCNEIIIRFFLLE